MRVATSIVAHRLADAAKAARLAETRGYDVALTMENQHEPYLPIGVAAINTDRIELGTAIALAFTRSPVTVAYTAHDLQVSSDGRFVLGVGSQVKGHNERRFSVPWVPPAGRLKEYVEVIRAVWRTWELGDKLNYEGDHYQVNLMPPNFCPPASGLARIPITISAVGPAMMRLSGSHCDGVRLHPFCTRKYIENVVMPELATGLGRSGRDRRNFEISGGGFIATGPDEQTVTERVEWIRYRIAFYGSTRSYHGVLAQHGLEDLGMKLHAMAKAGQWTEMAAQVPDDVIPLFAAIGTFNEIAARIEERFGGISDTVAESQPPGVGPQLPESVIAGIQAIPSRFESFDTHW